MKPGTAELRAAHETEHRKTRAASRHIATIEHLEQKAAEYERTIEQQAPEIEARTAAVRELKTKLKRKPTLAELDAALDPVPCARTSSWRLNQRNA